MVWAFISIVGLLYCTAIGLAIWFEREQERLDELRAGRDSRLLYRVWTHNGGGRALFYNWQYEWTPFFHKATFISAEDVEKLRSENPDMEIFAEEVLREYFD